MKRKLSDSVEADAPVVAEEVYSDYDDDANVPVQTASSLAAAGARIKCPYLDTINRQMIDFDSEKLCSVTLTNMNVYVCLVCGKYYHGRGKATPAFTHSVQAGHFVFMNLHSGRAYCLPDGYAITDSYLQDIQRCLSPQYSLSAVSRLNSNTSLARDVHGLAYLPGFVGLNNLNCTDYLNAVLQALAHVTPFRDFWLQDHNYELVKSAVVQQFGLVRGLGPYPLPCCIVLLLAYFCCGFGESCSILCNAWLFSFVAVCLSTVLLFLSCFFA
jgi:hypothetical protein